MKNFEEKLKEKDKEIEELKKIKEDFRYRIGLENLATTISARFINLPMSELREHMNISLKELAEFKGYEECAIILFDDNLILFDGYFYSPGIDEEYRWKFVKGFSLNDFPWTLEKYKNHEYTYVTNLDELPREAYREKKLWEAIGLKSLMTLPCYANNKLIGHVAFQSTTREITWSEEDINLTYSHD